METSRELGCNPWEILPLMKATNIPLNVGLEDWLDAEEIE
jgi:hypothetical protein